VAGDERLRLFCGLRLDDRTLDRLVPWQTEHLRGGRIVPRANLHVTLAFLGSRSVGDVEGITAALRSAAAAGGGIRLRVRGYRETRSVGMLTFDDEGGRGRELAERLFGLLEERGVYRREARPWLPHATVLRFRERPRLDPPLPDLGAAGPSDAAVYSSVLRSAGAQYEVLESIALNR
jgi:2'-5' RNA ligase